MNNVINGNKSFAFYPRVFLLLILFCFQTAFATPTTPTSDFIDNGDGTVTHKLTGLVWMRCSMGQTWDKATSTCLGTASTHTYTRVEAFGSTTFAGHNDWRLPNIAELQTIVERENGYLTPTINTTIFPNAYGHGVWSSSPYANNNYDEWYVSFFDGGSKYSGKSYTACAIRLVREGQWTFSSLPFTTPTSDFTDNQDGTVTHKRTGLIWQRCAVGQTWTGSMCSGAANPYTYVQAIDLTSTFASYNDWRVPNENELLSIVEYGAYNPAINQTWFPNTPSNSFWSSLSIGRSNLYALGVYFKDGYGNSDYKFSQNAVRLVRGKWSSSPPPNLDMTKASCRYVVPIYAQIWQQMKVNTAPTCSAVLRYHTWINTVRPENYMTRDTYITRLAGIDSRNQLLNQRLQNTDDAIAMIWILLDPDLRRALTPSDYQLSTNIIKSKGIVASLAAGQTPFKRNTVYGRVLDKIFKDKIIAEGGSKTLCNLLFDDATDVASCGNEAAKVAACGLGLATEGWNGVTGCVLGATTSFMGTVSNTVDLFEQIDTKQRLYGYILINDYLDAYFAKGRVQIPTDDAKLEAEIQKINSLNLNSGYFADFSMQFVKDGIRDGINRTVMKSAHDVKLVESLRKILQN